MARGTFARCFSCACFAQQMAELLNRNFRSIKTHCPTSCVFAPVTRLIKTAFSDTILRTRRFTINTNGTLDNVEVVNTPIKAGSLIVLDINGLHYNREFI